MQDKRIIIDSIKKVLSLYNVVHDLKDEYLEVKIEKNSSKIKDKLKVTKDGFLEFNLQVRANTEYRIYNLNHKISMANIAGSLRDISFICLNCLRVLKSLLNIYFTENVSEIEIYGCLEETIETSVIAIAVGKKQPFAYKTDPVVCAISHMIHSLNKWSYRTYEGRKIPYSFLVSLNNVDIDNISKICEFLKDDASALLTDGITSYVEVSDKILYKVTPYYDAEQTNDRVPLVPYRFSSFGNVCTGSNLGIVLTVQGDILFIRRKRIIFAKRNGDWHCYDYDAFNEALFKDVPQMHFDASLIKIIYLTCLDVAFARTGGCIAICNKDDVKNVKKCINSNDLHKKFYKGTRKDFNYKRFILEDIVINEAPFYSICRKARQELLGVDGATVILTKGDVVTTGAIMDNKFKNAPDDLHGGARTKIAMKLSEFGVAIKISADGYIECYKNHIHIY